VPSGAVSNGPPDANFALYVCRAPVGDASIPGKLLSAWGCYWGTDTAAPAPDYQVLVPTGCAVAWNAPLNGIAPPGALECGQDSQGPLYACRLQEAAAYPGELGFMGWSTNHMCTYSYGNQSLTSNAYDVLTVQ
jgi:hypothetical protein